VATYYTGPIAAASFFTGDAISNQSWHFSRALRGR